MFLCEFLLCVWLGLIYVTEPLVRTVLSRNILKVKEDFKAGIFRLEGKNLHVPAPAILSIDLKRIQGCRRLNNMNCSFHFQAQAVYVTLKLTYIIHTQQHKVCDTFCIFLKGNLYWCKIYLTKSRIIASVADQASKGFAVYLKKIHQFWVGLRLLNFYLET